MLLHLLACGWFEAAPEEQARTLPPRERLEAALPGLATAAAEVFGPEDAQLEPLADLVDATDRELVKLLIPRRVQGPLVDLVGERAAMPKPPRGKLPEVDLLAADVNLRGGVLSGSISGEGVEEGGAGLELDLRGGPAPEVLLRFPAPDTVTVAPLERWVEGPAQAIPGEVEIDGDTVRFRLELTQAGRVASGHVGAAVARVERSLKDHTLVDRGPAGRLGKAVPHALHLLRALMDTKGLDPMDDPDLTLAVALGFGAWRGWVAPEVRPVVETDARSWLRYGLSLDSWLARKEAPWRLAALPPGGKLLWAWPGSQSVAYGALAVGIQEDPLTLARYRFAVPDAETLTAWRDAFPLGPGVLSTANLRDEAIWEDLRYRASPAAMEAVCGDGRVRSNMCAGWAQDRSHGKDLGEVDGVRIPLDGGVSASHQLRVRARENDLVGDCATATTVSLAALQAVGIPGIAVGYAGADWSWPTHVQPAFLVGERFYSPQAYPGARWAEGSAWTYLLLPVLDSSFGAALGQEPGGAARGPGVAGGRMDYGALSAWGEGGIPLAQVMSLLQEAQDGGWPELGPLPVP